MATSAAVEVRSARNYDALVFHSLLFLFIVAVQFVYIQANDLEPDNTWHYRFAREIVTGEPVYWAGIDANRLFPDLIFAIIAFVLSRGATFVDWAVYFYIVYFVSLQISLVGLAVTIYENVLERRAFVLLSLAGLWAFHLGSPFWGRHIIDPGNHGTGLPVALGCLALVFWMNNRGRFSELAGGAFLLAVMLLVGSNRFLLVGFVAPLLLALVLVFVTRWASASAEQRRAALTWSDPRSRLATLLVGMVFASGVAGLFGQKLLGTLSWHKSVTHHTTQILEHFSLAFIIKQLRQEIYDFLQYYSETRHVAVGPLLMISTLPAPAFLLLRAVRNRRLSGLVENRVVFGLFAAASSVFSMAFLVFGWSSYGNWRYRFFAMALAFAVTLFAMLLSRPLKEMGRPGLLTVGTLVGLIALTSVLAAERSPEEVRANQQLARDVERLKQVLAKHGAAVPFRGLSEYWLAMDISARTDLRIDVLHPETLQFGAYHNNVGHLCRAGYSFILRPHARAPKREALIAAFGEPRATEEVEIQGPGKVEVLFYDPGLLHRRITEEGRTKARELFPEFRCES